MVTARLLGLCLLLVVFTTLCAPTRVYAHPLHSLDASYVPWGVDEDELFGLTKADIAKKYKDNLGFDEKESRVFFVDHNRSGFGRPGFIVTFSDGKIATVKRLFIDGAGCYIVGPICKTKKEALQFIVDGLSKDTNRSPADDARLKEARRKLSSLSGAAK
jgi:hypothetical protein